MIRRLLDYICGARRPLAHGGAVRWPRVERPELLIGAVEWLR